MCIYIYMYESPYIYIYIYIYNKHICDVLNKNKNTRCTLAANSNIYCCQVALWVLRPNAIDSRCFVFGC